MFDTFSPSSSDFGPSTSSDPEDEFAWVQRLQHIPDKVCWLFEVLQKQKRPIRLLVISTFCSLIPILVQEREGSSVLSFVSC